MKRRLFCATLIALVPAVALAQPKAGPPPTLVVAEPAGQRSITPSAMLMGTVMPPRKSVVGSAVEGRVEEVFVEEGDRVTRAPDEASGQSVGQPLAQVLTETIKIELKAAEAELKLRQHELKQMEIAATEIRQDEARLKATEALRTYARSKLGRIETLFKQNRVTTKEELDEAISAAEAAEQNYHVASLGFKVTELSHPERIEQTKAKVAVQQEEVNRINDRLRKYTVRAPFTGYVSVKHTEVGAWIKQGDPVAEVIELDEVDVVVAVPENYVAFARKSVPSDVSVDSLPGQTFSGQIVYVVPQADLKSRTFPVKIRVANPKTEDGIPVLKAGMLARAKIPVGPEELGTVVRRDALVLDGERKFVFVATIDAKTQSGPVRREEVKTGASDGTLVVIRGNVKPGELVVTEGNERLPPPRPNAPPTLVRLAPPKSQPEPRQTSLK